MKALTAVFGFLKKKLPNWLENLLWGALIIVAMQFVVVRPLEQKYERLLVAYENLASQEKYKIENRFDKIKTTQDGRLVIELDNQMFDLSPSAPVDTITGISEKKKNIFQRIFRKNR